MNHCPESEHIESWLDGELSLEAERALEGHLAGCARCRAERASLESLYASLRVVRLSDPGPGLTERILDRVLPSRIRRRYVTVLGWCYTAASAVTTFAFISWIVRPETQLWLGRLVSAAYGRLIDTGLFALDAITATALRVQHGLGLLELLGGWLVPVARAVGLLATDPRVAASLWAAVAACALLLWWMRPRQARVAGGNRHVGILAF
jgi:predicted anti-sigma-YlaC factor YlaD